jgi:hypothetical protein
MSIYEVPTPLRGHQITHWFRVVLCGVVSACTATPGAFDPQASSDSGSQGDPIDGSSDSGSDSDANSGSDSTTDVPLADLGAPGPEDPNEQIPPLDEEGCHGIYAQDLLPTFELTISSTVWDALVEEWINGQVNEDLGVDPNPYHPLAEFRYGDILITDAMIRLRGNPTYWNPENKMQFQIGFTQYHDSGRFLGLRRLAFDAAGANRHMLRDRLALSIMRDMGIIAPCANNARLEVNGEYYGLFTSLEKLDETFLERVFDDPTGDLWDRHNWELKTNEVSTTDFRLESLKNAETIDELAEYLDLEQALRVFAAEAIIPNSDGMWAGGLNFFLYDDPLRDKFVLLPWDLDNTFERFNDAPDGDYPSNPDPVVWEKPTTHGRPWYDMALEEPEWFAYYLESIDQQFASGYAVEELHSRIDTWTTQIGDSVFADTNKPYSNDLYLNKVEELHEFVQARHDFMVDWLACWHEGGIADSEGYCEIP